MSTAVSIEPVYQFMPAMSPEDFTRLKESIATHGYVGAPVVLDEDGRILDGHHRAKACAELGLEYPSIVQPGLSADEKWDYVWVSNVPRRHLTVTEKTALAREYIRRHPAASARMVGRDLGLSHVTVSGIREKVFAPADTPDVQNDHPHGRRYTDSDDSDTVMATENAADHRNMVWFELTIGYAAPSDRERVRNGTPYPRESERKEWTSGRQYLTSTTPTSTEDADALAEELANRLRAALRDRSTTMLTLR